MASVHSLACVALVALAGCAGEVHDEPGPVESTEAASALSAQADTIVKDLAPEVRAAASQWRIPAALVAAVLRYEIAHRGREDDAQDRVAERFASGDLETESGVRTALSFSVAGLPWKPACDYSFGLAQMKPTALEDMAANGYRPFGDVANVCAADESLRGAYVTLVDRERAPALVAARIREIADCWAKPDNHISGCLRKADARNVRVDLLTHPAGAALLGDLYAIGLVNATRGVHSAPGYTARGTEIACSLSKMGTLVGAPTEPAREPACP